METPPSGIDLTLPPLADDFDPAKLPNGADVAAAIDEAEEEEAKRKAWISSPEAIQQREASKLAYSGLSATEAEDLLSAAFAAQLAQLNSDPARFLSDAQLLATGEEETAATVKDDGQRLVMDAGNVPVQTVNQDGELAKVDLSLRATAHGWKTKNALVDVYIPTSPDQPVEVGDKGVSLKLLGAETERGAQLFGDENVLATEVLSDTDMLISPLSTGVEIFNQLRSARSPETLRYQVAMPAGAVLRADDAGGAEVISDGELLGRVAAPIAVDAQGTDVPVTLQVDGDTLVFHLAHRSGDFAMPILLDPEWYEVETILENNQNWIYGENHNALDMGVWAFNKNVAGIYGSTYCIHHCFGQPSNVRGLFVSGQPGTYWPEQFGQWSYSTPNPNSFIWSASLGPFLRYNDACNPTAYPQPHDYFGLWNPQGWAVRIFNSTNHPAGSITVKGAAQAAIFGLGSGTGDPFTIGCWRDIYAAGAHVWLSDWGYPWLSGSPVGVPSGWVSDETPFTISAVAKDDGLGIKNVRIHQQGGAPVYDIPPQNECAGTRRSPCLTTHAASFDNLHGGYFFQGERDTWLKANDAIGRLTGEHHWTMRVDNTPPELTLKGQFAEATNEVGSAEVPAGKGDQLRLPVYNLEIEAKDGNKSNPLDKRSGVKDIEIYLDDPEPPVSWVEQAVPWEPQPCSGPDYSCEMKKTYEVELSRLTHSGKHVLKVEAVDQVGKRLKREIEFEYFPATGMKDEYVMHYFPLPDGSGSEEEEEHPDRPELAVNVMNGNLVYREQDIEIEGTAVDLEVERYYNSMLPENEDTEWGDGWTLAQTPELDPVKTGGSPVPNEAEVLDSSGAIEEEVVLPTEAGAEKFDPSLQATLTKKSNGGYELSDETGESATSVSFDETGQTEALLSEGYAKVDYSYEGGELAEIEVIDPATFAADPAELEIPEPELITAPVFESSFGANGAGDGQLKSPGDVAVDAQGNLWVVDKSNNRVQKFDVTGKFLAKFGSFGSGNGQFNRPTAIALAANGELLITDSGNARVQRFSPAGAYLSKFGSSGSGNGQFAGSGPEGIVVDASGAIWVSDTYGGRLQKFTAAGEFVKVVGSKGSGAGQLGEPTGIDVAPNGDVWVADWQNNRVSVFDSNGEFLSKFGSAGSGDGQFSHPDEIEIDKLGNVWVGDQSNNRIQQFDLSGQFKAKFGSPGAGKGQFSFAYPMGIAADSKGHLWIADVNNHRIHEWQVPISKPAYISSFGSNGTGDGQLKSPGDVAVGVEGNLWVVDKANNRIQKFDPNGKFLAKFGSVGSGEGQFDRPAAVAVDRDGNLLVADANNDRIQKFSPDGDFISEFGSTGSGDGQFYGPEGIATDFEGNIWVADTYNSRIQKFDEAGQFIDAIGQWGEESGRLGEPTGIDVDGEGNVWVADWWNNRVSVFDSEGEFLDDFGSSGTGNGQFQNPDEIEIDSKDNVWVGDQTNGRVQRFDLDGTYVGQFGSAGSGEGQFSFTYPMGIAADRQGRIWIADVNNHRIQRWQLGHYAPPQATQLDLSDGDPKVEVETDGGLVESVTGNAAGEHTYEHDGDFLTSHDGPEGETVYEEDPATGLLSKVTLPNGTWAQIKYLADQRVESVEVKLAGETSSKTTSFHYSDDPRWSKVTPPGKPQITYDIAGDGSVFKWSHKDSPPEIIALNGSLGFDKNGQEVTAPDLLLEVEADSPHGVASIQIIANGDQLVSEKLCEQDPDPEIECTREEDLWATDTASLPPGVLNIEVIVTGENEKSASKRWWVEIPHTPPPVPGAPVPPKFSEIKEFREDYGLEVVFPVSTERQLVERIYGLINAWYSPGTPAGEVARASMERWGVPLRPEDVAELEWRERYVTQSGPLIREWGEAHASASYGGYWIDHRAGGILRLGFKGSSEEQEELVGQIEAMPWVIGTERFEPFVPPPARPLAELRDLQTEVSGYVYAQPAIAAKVTRVGLDVPANVVSLGATEPSSVSAALASAFGSNAAVHVFQDSKPVGLANNRRRHTIEGQVQAGDAIDGTILVRCDTGELKCLPKCTAAFGARDPVSRKPNGELINAHFTLTAGHCFQPGEEIKRAPHRAAPVENWKKIGTVRRDGLLYRGEGKVGYEVDALAIRMDNPNLAPRWIFLSTYSAQRFGRARQPAVGETVCFSGQDSEAVRCAPIEDEWLTRTDDPDRGQSLTLAQLTADLGARSGDSGSPVWSLHTGEAVGIVSQTFIGSTVTLIQPLLPLPGRPPESGVLTSPDLTPLKLLCWNAPC